LRFKKKTYSFAFRLFFKHFQMRHFPQFCFETGIWLTKSQGQTHSKSLYKSRGKKKKLYRQELNLLPLAIGVLLPLVLFENPSNTLASVELGARCKIAESITNIVTNHQLVAEKIVNSCVCVCVCTYTYKYTQLCWLVYDRQWGGLKQALRLA
jgi:hypothetical protein